MNPKCDRKHPYEKEAEGDLTQRRCADHGGRGGSDKTLNQGMPGATRMWKRMDSSLEPSEGAPSCRDLGFSLMIMILILDFPPPEL